MMSSYSGMVGPKSGMTGIFIRGENTQSHGESHMKTQIEIGATLPQVKEYQDC
jgi:hypothetical protein